MISESTLFTLARSFPNVTKEPHFDKTSFRVKKKIFATYDAKANTACVRGTRPSRRSSKPNSITRHRPWTS